MSRQVRIFHTCRLVAEACYWSRCSLAFISPVVPLCTGPGFQFMLISSLVLVLFHGEKQNKCYRTSCQHKKSAERLTHFVKRESNTQGENCSFFRLALLPSSGLWEIRWEQPSLSTVRIYDLNKISYCNALEALRVLPILLYLHFYVTQP